MRSARTTTVPLVSTTLPSKMLMRLVSSELIRFASMCVGLSLSAFSAWTEAAGSARSAVARARLALFARVTARAILFLGLKPAAHLLAQKQLLRIVAVLHATARKQAIFLRDDDVTIGTDHRVRLHHVHEAGAHARLGAFRCGFAHHQHIAVEEYFLAVLRQRAAVRRQRHARLVGLGLHHARRDQIGRVVVRVM